MHILFCSNYILLVSFLCATCGLYSLFENVYTCGKDGTLNDSHIMIRYMFPLGEKGLWGQEGKICQEISQMGRKPTRYKLDFPYFTKVLYSQLKRGPTLNYYTVVKSGKVGEFWCRSLSQSRPGIFLKKRLAAQLRSVKVKKGQQVREASATGLVRSNQRPT